MSSTATNSNKTKTGSKRKATDQPQRDPFVCGQTGCGFSTTRGVFLDMHMLNVHDGNVPKNPIPAPKDPVVALSKDPVVALLKRDPAAPAAAPVAPVVATPALIGEAPRHVCGVCNKSCSSKTALKTHEVVHSEAKPFQCNLCDFRTKHKQYLVVHVRIHSKEKPYVCPVCPKRFADPSNQRKHTKAHTEGKERWACTECDYKATYKGNLTVHMRKHTKEQPFQCTECEYKTAWYSRMVEHKMRHTGEKPYACLHCSYRSTRKANRDNHMKRKSCAGNKAKVLDKPANETKGPAPPAPHSLKK